MLILSLPGGITPPQPVEIPGYSLGPAASDELPVLLQNALTDSDGEVHVSGPAKWSGFQNGKYLIQAVAAITDTDILLLMWHESEHQYTIVARVPFSEISSVSAYPGGGIIRLYFDDKALSLGDQSYGIDGETTFRFSNPDDPEKNKAAFLLLRTKIKLHESDDPTTGTT